MKIGIFTSSIPIGSLYPDRAKRAIEFLESKDHEIIFIKLISIFLIKVFY